MADASDAETTRRDGPGAPTTEPEPPDVGPDVDLIQALAILEEALAEPPHLRTALLDRACEGDPDLRRAVASMLAADARESALDTTPGGVVGVLAEAVSGIVLPTQLGSFEVLGLLGRGGMGVVYEAQQRDPDRRIALKTLNLSVSPALSPQVRAEAQAMARLLHVGIPQIYEVFEHGGQPVLAMELVRGAPLLEFTENLDRRERLLILLRVAEAVEHAHSRGVIHRDLKPGNILVTPAGQPKVLDFGIASIGGEQLLRAGTPAYMPPEQRQGERPDERSDVYALAVVAWEVLTGARPDPQDDDTNGLPPGLAAPLRRALEPDPERRLASVQALRDAWLLFLEEDTVALLIDAAEAESAKIKAPAKSTATGRTPADSRAAIEGHLAAARFGLEQALKLAPSHARAREALDRALHRAAAWRIERDELELAAYHLAEASVQPADLVERLDAARTERARRIAQARPPSQLVLGGSVLFAVGALFLAYFVASGSSPGYGLFGASSLVLILLTLLALWRWRGLIRANPETSAHATIPLTVPVSISIVDIGAWLRGWPPEQAHALALPMITCVALMMSLSLDRRYLSIGALHAALWFAAAAMPEAIYGFLAVSASTSALLAFRFFLNLRAIEAQDARDAKTRPRP